MALIDWPAGVPETPLRAGNRYGYQDNRIRSPMGYGPAKMRRRTTAEVKTLSFVFHWTPAEWAIFTNWYEVTLNKVDPFNFVNPYDGLTIDARFIAEPVVTDHSCRGYRAQVLLEELPT